MSNQTISACNSIAEVLLLRVTNSMIAKGSNIKHISERTMELVTGLAANILAQYKVDPQGTVRTYELEGLEYMMERHFDNTSNIIQYASMHPWYVGVKGKQMADWTDAMLEGGFTKHRVLSFNIATYLPVSIEVAL